MKRKVTKILGVILLFMIAFNTYCYADLVAPDMPGSAPSPMVSVGDVLTKLIMGPLVILAIATIITISVIVLVKSKKEKESNEDK